MATLRGFVVSEMERVLNCVDDAIRAPAHLVPERLRFRNPALSQRLNRIVSNCGRAAIHEKLVDLEDRLGATHQDPNPAYGSQTCSNPACKYVDLRRQGERFRCRLCGTTLHADGDALRTLRARTSRPKDGAVTLHKDVVLRSLVARVEDRYPGTRSDRSGLQEGPAILGTPAATTAASRPGQPQVSRAQAPLRSLR